LPLDATVSASDELVLSESSAVTLDTGLLSSELNTGFRTRANSRRPLVRRVLLSADCIALTVAFVFAEALFRSPSAGVGTSGALSAYLLFFATVPLWLGLASVYGLYDRDDVQPEHTTVDDLVGVFHV